MTRALQLAGGLDSEVSGYRTGDGALAARPELTAEMAKKLLAAVTGCMQEAVQRGGDSVAARDAALRGWGLEGAGELEDCLGRCCKQAPEDAFLRSWLALYRELARLAEPAEVPVRASPELLRQARRRGPGSSQSSGPGVWDACD
uniref:Uncharacterized protein n=1 Tax=Alexandrium monilatum TaxID=311494 RepID=A0A7S4Q9H1_9DINO